MRYIFVLDVGGSVAALDDPRCDRAWTKPGESLPSASGYARRDWLERERERERATEREREKNREREKEKNITRDGTGHSLRVGPA